MRHMFLLSTLFDGARWAQGCEVELTLIGGRNNIWLSGHWNDARHGLGCCWISDIRSRSIGTCVLRSPAQDDRTTPSDEKKPSSLTAAIFGSSWHLSEVLMKRREEMEVGEGYLSTILMALKSCARWRQQRTRDMYLWDGPFYTAFACSAILQT